MTTLIKELNEDVEYEIKKRVLPFIQGAGLYHAYIRNYHNLDDRLLLNLITRPIIYTAQSYLDGMNHRIIVVLQRESEILIYDGCSKEVFNTYLFMFINNLETNEVKPILMPNPTAMQPLHIEPAPSLNPEPAQMTNGSNPNLMTLRAREILNFEYDLNIESIIKDEAKIKANVRRGESGPLFSGQGNDKLRDVRVNMYSRYFIKVKIENYADYNFIYTGDELIMEDVKDIDICVDATVLKIVDNKFCYFE